MTFLVNRDLTHLMSCEVSRDVLLSISRVYIATFAS